jgi:hypothetical protein
MVSETTVLAADWRIHIGYFSFHHLALLSQPHHLNGSPYKTMNA